MTDDVEWIVALGEENPYREPYREPTHLLLDSGAEVHTRSTEFVSQASVL